MKNIFIVIFFLSLVNFMLAQESICDTTLVCDDEIDVLFILDNSGSISQGEFNQMTSITQNSILDISGSYTNAQFGIVHYGGNFGDKIYIEHDFTNATQASNIVRRGSASQSLNNELGGDGDDLSASLDAIIAALPPFTSNPQIFSPTQVLNKRNSSALFVVLYTDGFRGPTAGAAGSGLVPYTNYNVLKSSPFNANITVVHLEPFVSGRDDFCAAIASGGNGTYNGTVDIDINSPDFGLLPRQYIPADFTLDRIDILPSLPPCTEVQSEVECELLGVIESEINPDSCCYNISLNNELGPDITCVEAEIITPGVIFKEGSLQFGSGFMWQCRPSSKKVCLSNEMGSIPIGFSRNALKYCFGIDDLNPPEGNTQQVVFSWYCGTGDEKRLVCQDTVTTECVIEPSTDCVSLVRNTLDCNPENPYEYFFNFDVTNSGSFNSVGVVLDGLSSGFSFRSCDDASSGTPIFIPFPSGSLTPGNTATNLCVKIVSPIPIFDPREVCFNIGLLGLSDFCRAEESVCLLLESCCDPCEERDIVIREIEVDSAVCCYSVDIINPCQYFYFTRIETGITTEGGAFTGTGVGGRDAENWKFELLESDLTSWSHESGFIPSGTNSDAIQFCLGEEDMLINPQEIIIEWLTYTEAGLDSVACIDTLLLECDTIRTPMTDSLSCCPELENRIINGDFEAGNTDDFNSDYTFEPNIAQDAILPGSYGVISSTDASTICEQWSVDDHSTDCDGIGNFLVVNGQTGQTGSSTFWSQTITGLDPEKEYELCAFFKNLQQCCFDVKPTIYVSLGELRVDTIMLDSLGSNACAWQNINIPIEVTGTSVTINLELDESLLGDGNDFAMDDISLYELAEYDLMISTQDQRPKDANIMASINLMDMVDDTLAAEGCDYKWTVGLVTDIDIQGQEFSLDSMTVACGGSEQPSTHPWNTLTTDFTGYDGTNTFNSLALPGQFGEGMYMVQLEVSNCPCLQDTKERKFVGWFPSWWRQTDQIDMTKYQMSRQTKEVLKRLQVDTSD